MTQIKFSSSLPEHVRETWQAFAADAGLTDSAWLTRAIMRQAVHESSNRPEDPEVMQFLNLTSNDRLAALARQQDAA